MHSVFDHGSCPLCPAPFNLAAHVLGRAGELADKTALTILSETGEQSLTYDELSAAVRGTGTGLLDAGLRPGQMVLMRLGNTVEFPIAYLGAIAVGLVPIPTSSQLTTPEVERIVADLGPAAILHDPTVQSAEHAHVISLEQLRAMQSLPPCAFAMGMPNRMAYVVYTSGTSGRPRAVAHAHQAIWARRMMVHDWYDLHESDRLLHAGAFNWTYTLGTGLMDPWTAGATSIIPAAGTQPSRIPALAATGRATIIAAAPGVYRKILQHHDTLNLPHLRHGLSAGEKLSQSLQSAWRRASRTALYEAYGMSECSTFISSSPSNPTHGSVLGRPQTGRRVAIIDAEGVPVPINSEGMIAVHKDDPGLMLGYLNAAQETADRFRGQWFVTGDRGRMDPAGDITFLGRDDDMMNAGGYRVSPLEVEMALSEHPGIHQIGVVDVEVKEGASVIAAFYTGPDPINEAELSYYAAERLARYKQPRAFVHVAELPAGANGKLVRRDLRQFFEPEAQ